MNKNKWVAVILYALATTGFALGVYTTARAAVDPGRHPYPTFKFPN